MKHQIIPIELHKRGNIVDLSYEADGVQTNVSGEFYVDKHNNLHHIHEFVDGTDLELVVPFENKVF